LQGCQSADSRFPDTVWDYLAGAASGSGFPNTVDTSTILDNGIGIQWDTYFGSTLAGGNDNSSTPFQLNTLGTVPGELSLAPSSQTVNAGTKATLTATALDSAGSPAPGIPLHFAVSGANAVSGDGTTDAAGQAPITYTPAKAGTDTVSAFEDLDRNGLRGPGEPAASATVTVQGQSSSSLDKAPPKLTISAARSLKRKTFLKGLIAKARTNEPCSLRFELLGAARRRSRSFTRKLARKSLPTAGAGTRAIIMKPKRKRVSRARKFKVQLRVTATDRAGNKTVNTRLVRVH
jgi:hypothetical protein